MKLSQPWMSWKAKIEDLYHKNKEVMMKMILILPNIKIRKIKIKMIFLIKKKKLSRT